jgi:DNA-binding XRE family transcriptional regulator
MASRVREALARYKPVPFDPRSYAAKRSRVDVGFAGAYQQATDEFAALDLLRSARQAAGLSQAEVARRMGVKAASLARIESSIASRKHSPTLSTLRSYAEACGRRLVIGIE